MAEVKARKRGEKWEYRFEGPKIDGKRKQISKSGFRTKKEAMEAGTKAMLEYTTGTPYKPTESSVSDVLDEWLTKYVDVNLRPKTRASYRSVIEIHIKPALGHYRLAALQPAMLQDFANSLKTKGYSRRHVVNVLSTLKNALGYAVEPLRYIQQNPMLHVKTPKIEKPAKRRIVLQPDAWAKIISRFPAGNKYHLPLMLGYHLGLRISEAFALTWDDVDLEKREVKITKQIIKIKNGNERALWCFGPTKTAASVRTVKIGETLYSTLKAERKRQSENRLRYGEFYTRYDLRQVDEQVYNFVPAPDGKVNLICVDEDGSFVTTDSFKYCSRVIHHELKLEFDFHSLRHTHATILVENGANVKNVQARLGHEKIETTLQTYVHNTESMATESIEIFERAINK